ncbi:FAD-dependent oxidoreductase [Salsuginibacillus kocurii]|uniref:FAD-dependent oxidoreductase n=1 Tax=Salsuginibacillus kocurii TaxID=427078 RepID=UPI00036F6D02|nr:FAD/NAD(P)-binding protein [Salsuginibacillus kocurii]
MLEWMVVGGGIQGATMVHFLRSQRGVSASEIAWIDPQKSPLAAWKRCTNAVGMNYLRSPGVHHIGINSFSLKVFAKQQGKQLSQQPFRGKYARPSLEVFNAHADEVLKKIKWQDMWKQGKVEDLEQLRNGWKIRLMSGEELEAKRVILALGMSEQPHVPDELDIAEEEQNRKGIHHIFSTSLPEFTMLKRPVAVIGGGISAAQTVLALQEKARTPVHLISKHNLKVATFDSDPGWLGPKYMRHFLQTKDYTKRREMIKTARNIGTIPRFIYNQLQKAQKRNSVIVHEKTDGRVSVDTDNKMRIGDEQKEIEAETIILATGFKKDLPANEWLTTVKDRYHLPVAPCGFPIIQSLDLAWARGLHVMGALAELEIGPIAKNISGARKAAERICGHAP